MKVWWFQIESAQRGHQGSQWLLGLLLSIGLFYLAGAIWGPLYQGEDEATRNFKIFLLVSLGFVFAGGVAGYKVSSKA